MDLDSINFKVVTQPLEDAVKLLDTATAAVKNLTKATTDNTAANQAGRSATKEELASLHEQAKLKGVEADAAKKALALEEAATKARIAKIREEKLLAQAVTGTTSASAAATEQMSAVDRMIAKQVISTQLLRGESVQASDGITQLGDAFARSQAKALASAQIMGASSEQLQRLATSFGEVNRIMGTDPFDQSASGLNKMKKEISELNSINELQAKGLQLTKKELMDYMREMERLSQTQRSQGKSNEWLVEEQNKLTHAYSTQSVELNRLRAESLKMEEQAKKSASSAIKATQDKLKAEEYVAREMNRVQQATINSRDGTTTSTSNQLVRMEAALKASGVSAGEAANKIRVYKQQLLDLQKVANNKQIDNISRALGPQITDIGVGLATGQSPLTILLQQGGQLRDQMALAGVAANDMGKAIRRAGSEMGSSIWTTGKGVITGISGALLDVGKSAGEGVGTAILKMVDFTNKVQGTTKAMIGGASYTEALKAGRDYQNRFNAEVAHGNGILAKMFDMLTSSTASTVFAAGLLSLVAVLVTLGVQFFKITTASDDMVRSLALNGAGLAMTKDAATEFAFSMNKVGVSTTDAMKSLGEFAKVGNIPSQYLREITKTAVDMEKYAGVAIEETIKQFSSLAKDPVNALYEYAKASGEVNVEVLIAVENLYRQGEAAEAVRVATEAMQEGSTRALERIKNDLSPMAGLWIDIKSGISGVINAIGGLVNSQGVVDNIRGAFANLASWVLAVPLGINKIAVAFKAVGGSAEDIKAANAEMEKLHRQYEQQLKSIREGSRATAASTKAEQESETARRKSNKESLDGYKGIAAVMQGIEKDNLREDSKQKTRNQYVKDYIEAKKLEAAVLDKTSKDKIVFIDKEIAALTKRANAEYDAAHKSETSSAASKIESERNKQNAYNLATITASRKELEAQKASVLGLAEAETKLNKVKQEARYLNMPERIKEETEANYRLAASLETYAKGLDDIAKARERDRQIAEEFRTQNESETDRLSLSNAEYENQLELLGKSAEEQKLINLEYQKKIDLMKLDLKLKLDIAAAYRKSPENVLLAMEQEEKLRETYMKDVDLLNKNSAVKARQAYVAEFDGIRSAMSETISDALFHGGKGGSKKLRDAIMDQLKKPINVVINVIANAVTNGIQGMIGGSSGVMGQSGGFGGLGGIVDMGKNLYSMFTGGAGVGLVSSIGGAASSLGSMLGSSALAEFGAGISGSTLAAGLAGPTTAGATGAMGLGSSVGGLLSSIGNVLPFVGAAMAVLNFTGAFERWAGDPDAFLVQDTADNNVKNVDPKSALKRVILGKYGKDVPVEVRTGNPYQTSTTTPFGTIGFASGNARIKKNGQMITEYGETEDVSTENQKAVLKIFETYDKVVASALSESQVAKIAKDLQGWYRKSWSFEGGMIGQWVSDRYRAIFQSLGTDIGNIFAGLDINEGSLGNIVALFTIVQGSAGKISGLVDSIRSFADGTSKYIRENEKGAEALVRLITNLEGSNKLLDAIGQKTYASSLVGADMAQQLVDLFGSLANFQSGLGTYYDKFYTEQEKVATSTKNLQIVFKAMGMTMPQSTEQFRKLVDAQDLTTVKGRETFTALIGISSAFADLMQPVDEATNKMKEFTAGILEYIANLTLTEGASGNTFNAVKGQFATQIGKARGGDTSAMDSITDYADRVLEVAKTTASSTYEYEKILGSVKAELLGLTNGQTAGTILTTAAVTSSTTSTSPITTIADSSASTQELLVSILAKLTEMQSEERAEGEASVTNLSTIAKVFKRIDNGDSIRVINV